MASFLYQLSQAKILQTQSESLPKDLRHEVVVATFPLPQAPGYTERRENEANIL